MRLDCLVPLILVLVTSSLSVIADEALRKNKLTRPTPPNFVVILADDLDWTLGGTSASTLTKTRQLIGEKGATLTNWFVQTPVCCSSRAELFTGRVFHNLKLPNATSGRGCMYVDVADDPEHVFWKDYYFSNYFAAGSHRTNNKSATTNTTRTTSIDLNYKVGIFGKHLNGQNPTTFLPNGVDEMLINGGGAYLDPSFTHGKKRKRTNANGKDVYYDEIESVKFDNCTETTGMPCYSTSVIGNASLAWIRRQVNANANANANATTYNATTKKNPFFALISVKAPHIQDANGFPMAIPAPWYNETKIPEQMAPRIPNYNVTNNGHHWLVRTQPPLTSLEATMVDELYVSRLKTLLSIDDLVQDLVTDLRELGVLDNTYIVFTSDNGFRLGQFRMPQCKLHPYENDIRVPMMIRGPGIAASKPKTTTTTKTTTTFTTNNRIHPKNQALFTHVHLMPTLLGLATGQVDSQEILPATMDGTNLARLLLVDKDEDENGVEGKHFTASSVSALMEYTSLGNVVRYQHLIDTYNHSFVALRIMPTSPNLNTKSTNTTTSRGIETIANLKYIEFRDSREDWNNTGAPLERELYDLDEDPYELDNLLSSPTMRISPKLLYALEKKTDRLMACFGDECRKEHSTGLDDASLIDGDDSRIS